MKIDADVFDNDERIIINMAQRGVPIADFSREALLLKLTFSREISTDQDVCDMLDELISKIEHITDEEWDNLKLEIPFYTFYNMERNVDEVPMDESM